jgi:predicted GNAT family N-acyltransferase
MELHFGTYREIKEDDQLAIKELIIKGNEANASLVESRLFSSALTAYFKEQNTIIATTSIKVPEADYIHEIFDKAQADFNPTKYTFELGYVFVESSYRKQKIASILCSELIHKFDKERLFSTTRTDNQGMQSILNSFGFVPSGISYLSLTKMRLLQLYIRNGALINQEKAKEFVFDSYIIQR